MPATYQLLPHIRRIHQGEKQIAMLKEFALQQELSPLSYVQNAFWSYPGKELGVTAETVFRDQRTRHVQRTKTLFHGAGAWSARQT